jgi:hypothetical protein
LSGTTYTLGITGNVTGGSAASAFGLDPLNAGSGKITITGDVTGGSNATAYGVSRIAAGYAMTINGNVIAGTAPGVQAGYQSTHYISGDIRAANSVEAVTAYSSYYTIHVGGSFVCSADGSMPTSASCKLRLTGTASGTTQKWRDADANEITTKVPDYPAVGMVADGVTFDYGTREGTYVGGGPLRRLAKVTGA